MAKIEITEQELRKKIEEAVRSILEESRRRVDEASQQDEAEAREIIRWITDVADQKEHYNAAEDAYYSYVEGQRGNEGNSKWHMDRLANAYANHLGVETEQVNMRAINLAVNYFGYYNCNEDEEDEDMQESRNRNGGILSKEAKGKISEAVMRRLKRSLK